MDLPGELYFQVSLLHRLGIHPNVEPPEGPITWDQVLASCLEKLSASSQDILREFPRKIGEITESSLQDFETDQKYNCILLRYVTGFFDYQSLIVLLFHRNIV